MINKKIDVAVAVIFYDDVYLLGYRNAQQHQGERYEFVGGKIEPDESALQGLIREVDEEIGLTVSESQCTKMGDINHDYGDKNVCLHVYAIEATDAQYQLLAHTQHGKLNQPICWVAKTKLIAGEYPLPTANAVILEWLAD